MKLRFCSKGCLRRSLVPSVGAEAVEFRVWVFLSVFGVLETSEKGVRSMSLSWKQPSNAIAWLALKDEGICQGQGEERGVRLRGQRAPDRELFSVSQKSHVI